MLRWGIIGTGYIANAFGEAIGLVEGAEPCAVCATSKEKAEAFGKKYGFATFYDNFDLMLKNAKPDAVYIAVPNLLHYNYVMQALDMGVHVLCEKPIADNAFQLGKMIAKAREKKLFLMEGMWTRCFPVVKKVKEWINSGIIGQVKSVRADFGLKAVEGWQGWKASAVHGGGALRDVGIYAIAWAFLAFFGEIPEKIDSVYRLKDGADFHSELFFHYSSGRTAFLTGTFDMVTNHEVLIYGEKGLIITGPRLWCPQKTVFYRYSSSQEFVREEAEVFEDDYSATGMQYEIAHVTDCILSGKTESPLYSLNESLAITQLIDSLRKEWGVRYMTDTM
jgi:predicted dehydrogenase